MARGKEFTDRPFGLRKRAATGAHEFDQLCAGLGIEHRLTPPKSPQTNGMVERFNGRIEEVLQSHHFRSGEELETTLHRYVLLYNQQLPQSALGSKTPLQAMKDWHKLKPELFRKQPYHLPGCDMRAFPQHFAGDICLEDRDGRVHRGAGFASMEGSFRVEGGMTTLAEAMAARLPAERLHPDSHVRAVERDRGILLSDGRRCLARHVVLAMPPRLVAGLGFTPPLPDDALRRLRSVPTWMAGHAKCVALYDRPFWREAGLSGDAMSRRGPLAEIHDASGAEGTPAALFGFLGVPAALRAGRSDQILDSARQQLARIFGPEAGSPRTMDLRDWAFDPLTATAADRMPPQGHPAYGPIPALARLWDGRLHLAATEIAPDMGGLMEGALASAGQVAGRIIGAEV